MKTNTINCPKCFRVWLDPTGNFMCHCGQTIDITSLPPASTEEVILRDLPLYHITHDQVFFHKDNVIKAMQRHTQEALEKEREAQDKRMCEFVDWVEAMGFDYLPKWDRWKQHGEQPLYTTQELLNKFKNRTP